MIKFEDKFVRFRWSDKLTGKKCLCGDSIEDLEQDLNSAIDRSEFIIENTNFATSEYPFAADGDIWKFVYYDPNLECKRAYEQGKQIQFKSLVDGTWCDCGNMEDLWLDNYEYRIKPDTPCLKWIDLKVGDVIQKGTRTAMVIDIVTDEDTERHISAGCRWFTDEELKDWRKVND